MKEFNYSNLQNFVDAVLYQKPVGWSRKEAAKEAEMLLELVKRIPISAGQTLSEPRPLVL
jgi:hypothetical protein